MINKKVVFTSFFLSLTIVMIAQRVYNSPYSRFGIGDLNDGNTIAPRSMGGLSSSFVDPYNINAANPASLAHLYASSFEVGANATHTSQTDRFTTNSFWNGNLDYLALSFPLSNALNDAYEGKVRNRKFGMSLGLYRKSNVGYNITAQDTLNGTGFVEKKFQGKGGTYNFVWGTGMKYKDFSIGVNLKYVFGNIEYSRVTSFVNYTLPYDNISSDRYFMSGLAYNIGGLYNTITNKTALKNKTTTVPNKLSIGFTLTPSTGFSTNSNRRVTASQLFSGTTIDVDTISFERNVAGSGRLPFELSFGMNYSHQEKYGIGFEVGTSSWSNYFNDANYEKINSLNNTLHVSFGGYIRPDYKSYTNFFKRVQYRYGAYYRQDPRKIGETQLNSYGITTGLGLPFIYQRKFSNVNLGLDVGRIGDGTPVKETYFKISAGISFNDDEWFIKRKYN